MSTAISGSGARTAKILSGAAMLFAIVFWLVAVTPYLSSSRESFGEFADIFWDRRYGLWLHILGGTIALFLGPVQIWLGETRQRYPLHRTLGTVYGVGVAISSAGAFYMVFTTPVGPVYAAGLFGMAVAALGATVMAFRAIRHRAIAQHREWMLRGYVAILAFVFFRGCWRRWRRWGWEARDVPAPVSGWLSRLGRRGRCRCWSPNGACSGGKSGRDSSFRACGGRRDVVAREETVSHLRFSLVYSCPGDD